LLVNLPNGKTVNMSIEQYLALEDEDIQYMISTNCGSTASSPWCGSAVKKPGRVRVSDEDPDPEATKGLSEDELELDEDIQSETDIQDPDAPEQE